MRRVHGARLCSNQGELASVDKTTRRTGVLLVWTYGSRRLLRQAKRIRVAFIVWTLACKGPGHARLHAAVSASLEPQAAAFVGSSIIQLNAEAKLSNVERHPENAAV